MNSLLPRLLLSYLIIFIATRLSASCYPLANPESNLNKNEKRYPNGTVVGKYTYMDNDGYPVQVKYFADEASYGIELKSVKVIDSKADSLQSKNPLRNPQEITNAPFEFALDSFTAFKESTGASKNLTFDPLQLLSKGKVKENLNGDSKTSADYEIFMQNELKAPEKCGKEKVKIYFDKDKRKTRNVGRKYDSAKYCNRI